MRKSFWKDGVHLQIAHQNIQSLKDYFENEYDGDPDEIVHLECYENDLVSLHGCPRNVRVLWCHRNLLETLEGCGPSVERLFCHYNYLNTLQGCPPTVKKLWCYDNELTTLWGCPPTVTELDCHKNHLKSLEFAPANYRVLMAHQNPLAPEWHCLTNEQRHAKIAAKRFTRGLSILKRAQRDKMVRRFCDNLLERWYAPDENGVAPYAVWTWRKFQAECQSL